MKPPLVFVHGAFCGGWAFDEFKKPFQAEGFEAYAPTLPEHEDGADMGRLARLGLRDYAHALVHQMRLLKTPPVLIGHSLGGLVCQIAASKTAVAGLVLLAPSAPWGVMPTTLDEHGSSFGLSMLGDYWRRPVAPDYGVARHATLDRMDHAAARKLFARFVPESGRAMMEAVQWWFDPTMESSAPAHRIHAPVLGIAGGRDKVNPASTVKRIIQRFPSGQADFATFPDMSHWLIGEPEWRDVADHVLRWLQNRDLSPPTRRRGARSKTLAAATLDGAPAVTDA
jgi:pimeloyl-ACP methyl ester carboxylesterase